MTFDPLASMGTPISRSSYVVETIRRKILSGEFEAGRPLVETELASAFAMSKTPVREALKTLSGNGLVTMSEFRGAVVRSVDAAMARDVFDVRRMIEPKAVALAVTRGGIDVARAREALDHAGRADGVADRSMSNREFHRLTYATCGNPLLISILDGLRDQTALITVTAWSRGISWEHEAHEHAAILAAIEAGDAAEAERLDAAHIAAFAANALEKLEAVDA